MIRMSEEDMTLENEIALVTGASRGIGKAIAMELGNLGATVVGTATSQKGADQITAYLGEHNINGSGVMLDVTQSEMIAPCLKEITEKYAAPSILINNAGITRDNLLMRMKEEEWDSIIDTNLSSIFRLSKACLRSMMKARKGRIISITSIVGVIGNPGQVNYSAAKAGIIGFSKSLAREIGSRGITVNTVAPGFIDTDMTKALSEDQRKSLTEQIPAGRLGSPEDIAHAVAFLSSPQAAYITGQTIHVNGGMFMS